MQDEFRRRMPICQNWVYFDHAAVGPLPQPAAQQITDWCHQATHEGDTVWPSWHRAVQQMRQTAAGLIHASVDEVALVNSTTQGIGLVAEGFPWRAGDNVVLLRNEFPSNLYPWMNLASQGVEARIVDPDHDGRPNLDRVLEACDDKTRLVAASWVGFVNGYRIDLARWTAAIHEQGAYFFLDAIQGLGVFPLDLQQIPVDFLAADGHKWMLGPEGAGLFFVRNQHLDLLRPLGVGWNSVVQNFDFDTIQMQWKPTAARYEGGTMNTVGFLALGASLEMLRSCGLAHNSSRLEQQVVQLGDYAVDRLQAVGAEIISLREPGHLSGIITFRLRDADHAAVREACLARGVVLSHRGGGLRISPHAYNNESDVDRLMDCLADGHV